MEIAPNQAMVTVPSAADRAAISMMRSMIVDFPAILQIATEDVQGKILPFLERLDAAVQKLPDNLPIGSLDLLNNAQPDIMTAFLYWYTNRHHLNIFNAVLPRIEQFNRDRTAAAEQINKYLSLINGYLNDSGKTLCFNATGSLVFNIEQLNEERAVNYLSSGEAQIFVILTHLLFNPAAHQANIFVIDEPELSLHVQWQETFVDSVYAANPTVQYIMATHSPSIIVDRRENCRDVVRSGERPR
jgi:hypothetical protein